MTESRFSAMKEGRAWFLALVEEVRPQLHRYCARMVGSVAHGEDIVQDTLAHAYYELPGLKELPAMRSWLFRIAHNRALDHMRSYERRMGRSFDEGFDITDDNALNPEDALARDQAVGVAVARFLDLPPAQRSCVILKDVLGHSLEEIAAMLNLSVPAVKAGLHRGRHHLCRLTEAPQAALPRQPSPAIARYVELFNARDWVGVRAMLADDVRLDLVTREKQNGRQNVIHYFTNYGNARGWRVAPAWMDDREILAVFRAPGDTRPGYFIDIELIRGQIAAIRDFRYVPYIGFDAVFETADGSPIS